MVLLKKALENKYFRAILGGLKPCIIGIIAATGCHMITKNAISPMISETPDIWPIVITVILAIVYFGSGKVLKKKMSPIMLIVVSAFLGIVIYGF
jgi:chromate transporter